MPMTPRQNTSSALLYQAEASLTHTPIEAKKSAAKTIHSACMFVTGKDLRHRKLALDEKNKNSVGGGVHLRAVPLVELLHAVFHRALVGARLVLAAQQQGAAAGVHALDDLVVFH